VMSALVSCSNAYSTPRHRNLPLRVIGLKGYGLRPSNLCDLGQGMFGSTVITSEIL
jgi:hypothetical protein